MKNKNIDITFSEWQETLALQARPAVPPNGFYSTEEMTERLGYAAAGGAGRARLRKLVRDGALKLVLGKGGRLFYKPVMPKKDAINNVGFPLDYECKTSGHTEAVK